MESGIHWGKSAYVHSESCEMSGCAWYMKASKLKLDVCAFQGKESSVIHCSGLNRATVEESNIPQLSYVTLTTSMSHKNGSRLRFLIKVLALLKDLIQPYTVAEVSGLQGVFL